DRGRQRGPAAGCEREQLRLERLGRVGRERWVQRVERKWFVGQRQILGRDRRRRRGELRTHRERGDPACDRDRHRERRDRRGAHGLDARARGERDERRGRRNGRRGRLGRGERRDRHDDRLDRRDDERGQRRRQRDRDV